MIYAKNGKNGVEVNVDGTLEDLCIEMAAIAEQASALIRASRYCRTDQHFASIIAPGELKDKARAVRAHLEAREREA